MTGYRLMYEATITSYNNGKLTMFEADRRVDELEQHSGLTFDRPWRDQEMRKQHRANFQSTQWFTQVAIITFKWECGTVNTDQAIEELRRVENEYDVKLVKIWMQDNGLDDEETEGY